MKWAFRKLSVVIKNLILRLCSREEIMHSEKLFPYIDVVILNDLVPHFFKMEVGRNSLWELIQISAGIKNISLNF